MISYKTFGTCSREINFEIENGKVKTVKFVGGCKGNTQGLEKLVEGMEIDTVIKKLSGIECRGNTSCPDQLARALAKYKIENNLK